MHSRRSGSTRRFAAPTRTPTPASDDSRHITGEIIDVNGGLFMD